MQIAQLGVFGLALALCAGCSSVKTNVNSGQIKATTFSFVKPPPKEAFAAPDGMEPIHAAIQGSITRNLAAKGVQNAASGGDLVVAYLIVVGNNAVTTSYRDYFGEDRGAGKLAEKAHVAYTVKNHGPNYFEAATLLIDVLDAQTNKLLLRKYVTHPIMSNVTADVRASRIQAAVDDALGGLQVAR